MELGIPLAVLLVGLVAEALLPASVIVTSVFAIAPFAASALTTPARTAVIAVLALTAVGLSVAWNHDVGSVNWWIRLLVGGVLAALAILLSRMRVRREHALQHMTVVAETAQRAVLRVLPGRVGDVGLATRYVSATEAALVGGDLYEVADTPYGVRVLIGDVRGKGLDAVYLASTVLAAFRLAALRQARLPDVVGDLDTAVTTVSGEEDFVTALIAEFHRNGTATVVNCGHMPPLMVQPGQPPRLLDDSDAALPLGLGSSPREQSVSWPDGSRMLLYTDGLVEARNNRGAFFPVDQYADELGEGSLEQALDRLIGHLHDFSKSQGDDMALVLIEHEPN